jgi:hypothetical protein
MSAPSFSSFPPSFASFPDLDLEESRDHPQGQQKKGEHKEDKHQKDKKRKRDRHKDSVSHTKSAKQKDESILVLDDERLKAEEDRRRRDGEETIADIGPSGSPLFYSDRKGDPLNIRYGGLHSGDVPKHHLVGRKSSPNISDDLLMIVKMAGRYWD